MQIMKYRWSDFEPFLILNDDGVFSAIRLFDRHISMTIGKRFCTGYSSGGTYFKCPNQTVLTTEYQCNECKMNDDFFYCIKCDGSNCINEKMRDGCKTNNYYIYLAAFGSILKVGMSFERRVLERLIEQGADFGAKICYLKDGRSARVLEQQIKGSLGIVDRLRGDDKHKIMFEDPNKAIFTINNAINKLKNNGMNQYMIKPEIYDLRGYYKLENVFADPKNLAIEEGMKINGNIVAAKGNLMVINSDSKFYSINAHRLYGREVMDLSIN
jgi:hypothetical protein